MSRNVRCHWIGRHLIDCLSKLSAAASILCGAPWAIADPPAAQPHAMQTSLGLLASSDASSLGRLPAALKRPDPAVPHELFGADRPGGSEPGEHPLLPPLRWAKECLPNVEDLKDYSATLVKRERIDGKLGARQSLFIKIRHKPFSVYTRGLAPVAIKGQEAIYVAGRNDGKLWAHPAGFQGNLVRVISLVPDGMLAMHGQRYPITEIGVLNLAKRLLEVADQDRRHDECAVRFFAGGKINDRACTWCEVVHPVPREFFRFHLARIFVDDQLKMPTRYEAYAWPSEPGGPPELIEEYTYVDLKLNNGFNDEDFSIANRAYHFR